MRHEETARRGLVRQQKPNLATEASNFILSGKRAVREKRYEHISMKEPLREGGDPHAD